MVEHRRPLYLHITPQYPAALRNDGWWYNVTYAAIELGRMRFRRETHNIQIVTYRHSSADRRSIKHAASGESLWNHFLICFKSLRMPHNTEPGGVQIVPAHSYARLCAGGGRGGVPVNPNLTPYLLSMTSASDVMDVSQSMEPRTDDWYHPNTTVHIDTARHTDDDND